MQSDLDRFFALLRRELGADSVLVLDDQAETSGDPCELRGHMRDGSYVAVRFATPPPDRELKQRRLEMLLSTFDEVVHDASQRPRSRPPIERSLRDELRALCDRAGAVNAIVIDANSPVEWGAARPSTVIPMTRRSAGRSTTREAEKHKAEPAVAAASRRALRAVRALPELADLPKGKQLRCVRLSGEVPFIVHSFAGIYLLIVVFDAPFNELHAERAIFDALPRIERFVLALPPLDPAPHAGVMALRRPRRRS